MVVYDLDIERIAGIPPKADAPLVVDPNAVLPGPVASEAFEPIRRWNT